MSDEDAKYSEDREDKPAGSALTVPMDFSPIGFVYSPAHEANSCTPASSPCHSPSLTASKDIPSATTKEGSASTDLTKLLDFDDSPPFLYPLLPPGDATPRPLPIPLKASSRAPDIRPLPSPPENPVRLHYPHRCGLPCTTHPFAELSSEDAYNALISGTPEGGITDAPPFQYHYLNTNCEIEATLTYLQCEHWRGLVIDHLELETEHAGKFFLAYFHEYPVPGASFYTIRQGWDSVVAWHGSYQNNSDGTQTLLWEAVLIGPRNPDPTFPYQITTSIEMRENRWYNCRLQLPEPEFQGIAQALRELPLEDFPLSHSRTPLPSFKTLVGLGATEGG
jgi:hypothetical protein